MESKKRDERHTLMCVVSLVLHGTGIGCDLQIQLWLWAQVATPSQTIFHLREETPWSKTLAQPNPGKMRVFSFKEALAYPSEMSGFKFPPQVLSVCGGNVAPPATDLSGLKHVIICIVSVCYPSSSTAEQVCTIKEVDTWGAEPRCLPLDNTSALASGIQEFFLELVIWSYQWPQVRQRPKWSVGITTCLGNKDEGCTLFEVGVYRCALRIPFFPLET